MIVLRLASLVLQLATVFVALRLIRVTGRITAWRLIAFGLGLMALRRALPLAMPAVTGGPLVLNPVDEVMTFIISIVLLWGVLKIAPFFSAILRTETALLDTHESLSAIIRTSPQGIIVMEPSGTVTLWNDAAEKILGWTAGEVLDQAPAGLPPALVRDIDIWRLPVLAGQTVEFQEAVLEQKDGALITVGYSAARLIHQHAEIPSVLGIIVDITERKNAEQELAASLQEKDVLLREIHHRVKNTLQVVCSLLNLQAGRSADAEARASLLESRDRVRAMGIVHERLYASGDLAHVAFDEYLHHIANELGRAYARVGIQVKVRADHLVLPIDQAVPCGLIVNELVTNAFRHAFVGREQGMIHIDLHRRDGATVELGVSDNGVGFPDAARATARTTMGMMIVASLLQQIKATMEGRAEGGTTFRITFPG